MVSRTLAFKLSLFIEVFACNVAIIELCCPSLPGKTGQTVRAGMNNVVSELRKCCLHPFLIDGVESLNGMEDTGQEINTLIKASGKLDLLDKILHRLLVRHQHFSLFHCCQQNWLVSLCICLVYCSQRPIGF